VPNGKGSDRTNNARISLSPRFIGQFILWAMITTVGGVIYMVLTHDKEIAVIEQRLITIEERIEDLEE